MIHCHKIITLLINIISNILKIYLQYINYFHYFTKALIAIKTALKPVNANKNKCCLNNVKKVH